MLNIIFVILYATSATTGFMERALINPELNEKTLQFLCKSTPRSPHCAMVCKFFPQFCQTTTEHPLTTTTPPVSCEIAVICAKGRHSCHSCIYCSDHRSEICCPPGHDPVPGPDCTVGDYSCYVCPSSLPTTTQAPETTTRPATTSTPITLPTTTTPPQTTTVPVTTTPSATTTLAPVPDSCGIPMSSFSCLGKANGYHVDPFDCTLCHACESHILHLDADMPCTDAEQVVEIIPPTCACENGLQRATPAPKGMTRACVNHCSAPPTTTTPLPMTTTALPTTPAIPTTTGLPVPLETCTMTCRNRADGLYASPTNCHEYYTCHDGLFIIPESGSCGSGFTFDYPTMSCMADDPTAVCYTCVPGVPLTLPPPPTTHIPQTTTLPETTTPPATTTASVTTTTTNLPTTTSAPCKYVWDDDCVTLGSPIDQCIYCLTCSGQEQVCCPGAGFYFAPLGCPVGDYSCYVCPPAVTSTAMPTLATKRSRLNYTAPYENLRKFPLPYLRLV